MNPRVEQTHQLLKDTVVQWSFPPSALPQLLVVVLQALPVFPELFEAALVNVFEDTGGAPCHLAALAQAVDLASAIGLGLAVHVVVISTLR